MSTKVVQITNIAPQATKDRLESLFGCIGKIDEIRLYPTVRDVTCPVQSRVCYVKFFESSCVAVAQHLTNTVFIDRALIVCPVSLGAIPDEFKALEIISNESGLPGLPLSDSKLPSEVVNRVDGMHPFQVIKTTDPKIEEHNLPEYPALPINTDARKIEEIRRTIIVIDVPADWEIQKIMDHFGKHAGEVKFSRFAEKSRQKHVMIEFCEQKSVLNALKMQGTEFLGEKLNIYHSMQAIIKPEAKSNEAAQREIEEAMSIVKETQTMLSVALDPVIGILSAKEKSVTSSHRRSSRSRSRTSRSRSRSRRSKSRKRSKRSKSRSRSRRKRTRSRSKRRSVTPRSRSKRSRSRSKRLRSRDRDRRKRSRSRRRSRSISRRRSRSRTYERERRERRERERVDRDRRRSRSPQSSKPSRKSSRKEEKRSRKSHSRSISRDRRHSAKESSRRSRRDEDKDRKESSRKVKRVSEEKPSQRDYDAEERIGTEDSKRDDSSDDASKSDNMDIANSP